MNLDTPRRLPGYVGGLFSVFIGLFFIVMPEFASGFIGILLGVSLLVAGVSEVIGYFVSIKQFREEHSGKSQGAEIVLFYSFVLACAGLFFIIRPEIVLKLLSTILGVISLSDGVIKLRHTLVLFSKRRVFSLILFVMALVLIIFGILLLAHALNGTTHIVIFSGISFLVSGIETCFVSVIKMFENKARKN